MSRVSIASGASSRCQRLLGFSGVVTICFSVGLLGSASAKGLYDDPRTAEGWAWSKIKQGEEVDLNRNCATPKLDPMDEKDVRWQDNCRKLSAHFLHDLLTRSPWREATPLGGISIVGARFDGNVDLTDVQLIRTLVISDSRVEGEINLSFARTNSRIMLEHFVINGGFIAENMRSESQLDLQNGVFKKDVNLVAAKIDGTVNASGSSFEASLNASNLRSKSQLDLQNAVFKKDVNLNAAKIEGNVYVSSSSFEAALNGLTLEIGGSLLMGSSSFKAVNLMAAKIAGQVWMVGSSFEGEFNASLARIGGYLSMASDLEHTTNFKDVNLTATKITEQVLLNHTIVNGDFNASFLQVGGTLSMISARINGKMDAPSMDVSGDFYMNSDVASRALFKEIDLNNTKIKGSFSANAASIDGPFNANSLHVDGDFSIDADANNGPTLQNLFMNNARINGNMSINGASIDGAFVAGMLRIGGSLSMSAITEDLRQFAGTLGIPPPQTNLSKASFKQVILVGSAVEGQVLMSGAVFAGPLNAAALRVGGNMYMRDAHCLDTVDLNMAHIGSNLDLRGATLAAVFDLSGASIGADLQLGGEYKSAVWDGNNAVLYLRNARVGNLMDAMDAWPGPGRLHLDGFPFGHLGGISGDTGQEMRRRGANWWDDWARRDPEYSPTTYAQLAAVFANAGDRDGADDIRYLGREREREMACKETLLGSCLLQSALGYVAGYGIGSHTFIVLVWVFGFWFASAALLWGTVPAAKNRGTVWCFCASLAQLLPVIQINKELTDFFNDPERARLKGWQVFVFSALGIIGLALGAVLLIAVSGLTHSS